MELDKIHAKLLQHFGAQVVLALTEPQDDPKAGHSDGFVTVLGPQVARVCMYCKVEPDLEFDFCQSITGVDSGETLTCVYHLYSYTHRHTLVLKTETPRAEPRLPTTTVVWPASNWYEREIFDLFGVQFEGHPDLRRLLLPDDWQGHPMLKDYKEAPTYNGIPTTRENPLDLLEVED